MTIDLYDGFDICYFNRAESISREARANPDCACGLDVDGVRVFSMHEIFELDQAIEDDLVPSHELRQLGYDL